MIARVDQPSQKPKGSIYKSGKLKLKIREAMPAQFENLNYLHTPCEIFMLGPVDELGLLSLKTKKTHDRIKSGEADPAVTIHGVALSFHLDKENRLLNTINFDRKEAEKTRKILYWFIFASCIVQFFGAVVVAAHGDKIQLVMHQLGRVLEMGWQ